MPDIAEQTTDVFQAPPPDPDAVRQTPQDPVAQNSVAQMNGYMAGKVIIQGQSPIQGKSRTVWQDFRGGTVQGLVDRNGRSVACDGAYDGAFETRVVDGQLLDRPASKGEKA